MSRAPTAFVAGAAGFIGAHLVRRLRSEGYAVRGADLRMPEFQPSAAQEFLIADLREPREVARALDTPFDHVYQLAADMGGAGWVFTGEHDADVMQNSSLINLQILRRCRDVPPGRILFSSSACVYPAVNQLDPEHPDCAEDTAYPAAPDSEYGWEKLFGERLYAAAARNHRIAVRIARLHNVYGPEGTWRGGREKAPAALCRKVAAAPDGGSIELWGDGAQTRSFLYIEDCLNALRLLMDSSVEEPLNIGSEEMISIGDLARMIIGLSGKSLGIRPVSGPVGVRGRRSDNRRVSARLGWSPAWDLRRGIAETYRWIEAQVRLHGAGEPG